MILASSCCSLCSSHWSQVSSRKWRCSWSSAYRRCFRWMPLDLTDKSTLVQVMAWCRQATTHYLSQCWTRSLPPYGITRPQWVKPLVTVKEILIIDHYSKSHVHCGVSNQQRLYCLFNSSLRLTSKKTSKLNIAGHLWRESTGDRCISHTKVM